MDETTRDVVETWLESQDSEWHEQQPGVYHASQTWTCHRKKWYQVKGEEEDLPLGLFHMGEQAEIALEEALKNHLGGHFVLNDIPVKHDEGDFSIVGRTDPVVVGYNLNPLRLYEVKSSRAGKHASTKPSHRHQAGFYAHLLGVEEVHIPHPARNDILDMPSPDHQIPLEDIPSLFEETVDHFDEFHEFIEADEQPPADPMLKDECKWCDFGPKNGSGICTLDGGWVRVKAGNGREVWRLEDDVKENDKILEEP